MDALQKDTPDEQLTLEFLGGLVEELGAQMYPSVTASVAELVSNAWDADASNVWVEVPLGRIPDEQWAGLEIVVVDDGQGMDRAAAQSKYLLVGRKRRVEEQRTTTTNGRPLHGRKGVGKLAAFGTARVLQCTSREADEVVAFELDYDDIRVLPAGAKYPVPEVPPDPLVDPTSKVELPHGTRIRLRQLKARRLPDEAQFRLSLARRFGTLTPEMRLYVNGTELNRFDVPMEFSFPRDAAPAPGDGLPSDAQGDAFRLEDGLGVEKLSDAREVRWWIGFTPRPIDFDEVRGVAILSHRKMVQRPFLFGRSQGIAGQLGEQYLLGEVHADWIDESIEPEEDLVLTNRTQLQVEDEGLQPLMEWGRRRVAWALGKRNDLRVTKNVEAIQVSTEVQERLNNFSQKEQAIFKNISDKLSRLPEADPTSVTGLTLDVIDSYDDRSVRDMIDQIGAYDETTQVQMWQLVSEFGLVDARRMKSKLEARLQVIAKLEEMVEHGAKEVPDIHQHLLRNPWVLDMRWELYDDEVDLRSHLEAKFGLNIDPGAGQFADYVFTLQPSTTGAIDEVIVVEIKRGTDIHANVRTADQDEVNKFHGYVLEAEAYFDANSEAFKPRVRGLMIAAGYTASAEMLRRSLEEIPGQKMQFKDWRRVLRETRLLHVGGLELSVRRMQAMNEARALQNAT